MRTEKKRRTILPYSVDTIDIYIGIYHIIVSKSEKVHVENPENQIPDKY